MALQHEDFGEKIGGAKKDLWRERGLYVSDLDAMNDREAEKYVKKDNVWKKPDYDAMLKDGIPLGVAFFVKKVRDTLPATPQYRYSDSTPEKRLARQKEYIETVRQLENVVSGLRTPEEVRQVYNKFCIEGGYMELTPGYAGNHFQMTQKGRQNPLFTRQLREILWVSSDAQFERDFVRKAKGSQFGVPKSEKVPRGYEIHLNDSKYTYSQNQDWKPNTYYVTKGFSILEKNFATRDAALKWVQAYAKEKSKSGKSRFVPPQLVNVRRTGSDYRNGADITGQDYLDTFSFRGGEFGNWMNQNDRQASLNMGFDALKDLASALQISDKDIAYGSKLAIAFGARGSGNAVAHYEPLRQVINLTKMHGAGSLAHEWWHGFDDYLGAKMGAEGFLSEHPSKYPLFQKLINTMKYKQETPEHAAERTDAQISQTRKSAAAWLDSAILGSLKRAENAEYLERYAVMKELFLSGEPGIVAQISALRKEATGHVIPKSERERLEIFSQILSSQQVAATPQQLQVHTDFYRNSVRMGKECEKDGGYWDSNVEMTARAFACYIKDKLPYASDYLAGHADCALAMVTNKDGSHEILKAFPEGVERKAINAVFDEIIQDLKREQILTHADVTLPLPVVERQQLTLFDDNRTSVLSQLAAVKSAEKSPKTQSAPQKIREPEI